MTLKFHKPVTPSKRNLISYNTKNTLSKTFLLKSKLKGLVNSSGKNHSGKITVFHRGGGHKKKFRTILNNDILMFQGIVLSLEYDPNRTANIASVFNTKNKNFYYILAPAEVKVGDILEFNSEAKISLGNRLPLSKIPAGSFIHNIFIKDKFKITKSAGCFSILVDKTSKYCKIRLSSGEIRFVKSNFTAALGIVSHKDNFLTTVGKAGRSRWLNKRPHVRGVAMNPIDHPHGGGEGKTSGGRTSVTPWGKPTKNKYTSRSKNNLIVLKRNKNDKK